MMLCPNERIVLHTVLCKVESQDVENPSHTGMNVLFSEFFSAGRGDSWCTLVHSSVSVHRCVSRYSTNGSRAKCWWTFSRKKRRGRVGTYFWIAATGLLCTQLPATSTEGGLLVILAHFLNPHSVWSHTFLEFWNDCITVTMANRALCNEWPTCMFVWISISFCFFCFFFSNRRLLVLKSPAR